MKTGTLTEKYVEDYVSSKNYFERRRTTYFAQKNLNSEEFLNYFEEICTFTDSEKSVLNHFNLLNLHN